MRKIRMRESARKLEKGKELTATKSIAKEALRRLVDEEVLLLLMIVCRTQDTHMALFTPS